ncbi:hypothetical protein N7474_002503 [Penicillium riverlandense]|uniref:uncharacterized protein n=1 Tax=Penicillium riverlandense TaxID=1903569 RepID=UPI002549508F|nr:uncharacterized protein N7474_002503 [Penicillium riverlandense]KAJ5825365.1 hypothetical protein N7474_002503 [Penicillium riverlandense]
MLLHHLFGWSLLAVVALAETNTTSATEAKTKTTSSFTTSSTTAIATHTIKVGPKTAPHRYVPHNITANVGDIVVFEFYPANHSVVKADYLAPCVPASEGLFYSGAFNTFDEDNGNLVGSVPTWSIRINDTKPTFFYCTAIGSCIVNGMVGAINPDLNETYEAQFQKALTYPYMLVPGQPTPAEGNSVSNTTISKSSPSAIGNLLQGRQGLSGGAIAGIVIACFAFVVILMLFFFVMGRNRVYKQWMSSQDGRSERTAQWALFGSNRQSWHHRHHSELTGDTPKLGTADFASVSSPTQKGYSSAPSSISPPVPFTSQKGLPSWHWDNPQLRDIRGPTELEAHSVVSLVPQNKDHE